MTGSDSFLIVVGVDGSPSSLAAVDWAVTEARLRNGKIRLVSAWYYPPLASEVGDGVIDDTFKNYAEQTLAEALGMVADQGIPVSGTVVENSPAIAMLDAARDANLVIVGSRGRGGFASLLLGSVSSQVVHHAHCPVLVVRSKAVAD
jgi:nucleotide-binding universal stress UspA family protein